MTGVLPLAFEKWITRAEVPFRLFITESQVISWFIKIDLKQFIAAIHAPRKFRMFFDISFIIFEANMLLPKNKYNW